MTIVACESIIISEADIMTPKEFTEKMKALAEKYDEEEFHIAADRLMGDLLTSIGYGEGVKVFEKTPKWYS